jgi:mannitol-1-phosphate/altronate dehydrogenase
VTLTGTRTFVGFGFGAIQSGLFLYEAFNSGEFCRLVVAEVVPEAVAAVQQENGFYSLNIAQKDRVEPTRIGPIEIYDPADETSCRAILNAIVDAEEIATAIPSVAFYVSNKPGSIHYLLAEGLQLKIERNGPRAVIYAAENHNHAAEILEEAVMDLVPLEKQASVRQRVQFLNTVIGKMSQVIMDPREVQVRNLAPITPSYGRAFLVEAFNRILISKVNFAEPFRRGLAVLQEKDDLLPFEEAKLYGHNATHAILGYLGALQGAQFIADLERVPGMVSFAREAFIEESGASLIRKYAGFDPLFTSEGYMDFAEDLLERMTNPFLVDMIERVTRDTRRKLGWSDRLIGTMRLALEQGIEPNRYALGAAAAIVQLESSLEEDPSRIGSTLDSLWSETPPDPAEKNRVVKLIQIAMKKLRSWRTAGFPNLEIFFREN